MKRIILIALTFLLITKISNAKELKVMTFNTTCAVCNKGKFDKYSLRKHWIVDTIKRHNPDLISVQEVLTSHQLKWIKEKLKDYDVYYGNYRVFKFTDTSIFIKKNRFKVTSSGGYWLGRKGGDRFSLGWKLALPRRVQWANLIDLQDQEVLTFVGAHFDNRDINKTNSAEFVIEKFGNVEKVIFAADTNLKPSTSGYNRLNSIFQDTYELAESFDLIRNSNTGVNDSCNLEKGSVFPDCKVDHIFKSFGLDYRVTGQMIDQYKYGDDQKFVSDHRALISVFEI